MGKSDQSRTDSTTKANGCGLGRFSTMKKPFQSSIGARTTTRTITVARDFASPAAMRRALSAATRVKTVAWKGTPRATLRASRKPLPWPTRASRTAAARAGSAS